jgi:hypothetical protein
MAATLRFFYRDRLELYLLPSFLLLDVRTPFFVTVITNRLSANPKVMLSSSSISIHSLD